VIRALAYTKLGRSDKASDITAASEINDRVIEGNHHEALIPSILLNEAKSKLDGV